MEKMENNNKKYDFSTNNNPMNTQQKSRSFGLFLAMFWAFFLALAISNVLSPYFSEIFGGLISGVTCILVGIVFSFVFSRMVDFIERVVLKNAFVSSPYKFAIKRTISIVAVLLVFFGIVAILLAIMVPRIIDIVEKITAGNGDGVTQIYNNVVNEICSLAQRWFGAEVSQESIKDILNQIFEGFISAVGELNDILAMSLNVLSGFGNFLLGILLAVLMLKDKEKVSRFCRRFTYAHFKKERADEICVITNNANRIMHSYVICKLIEFTMLFVSLGILYTILRLEMTWEIALVIAVFNFIPYIGVFIGIGIALLIQLCLVANFISALPAMLISTTILCLIQFNLIVPFIASSKLKVNPIISMSSTFIGGAMFGMWGMLIAPPIFAIISVIVMGNIELKENHMKYVMELNKAREQNMQDQKEQLGILPLAEELKRTEEITKQAEAETSVTTKETTPSLTEENITEKNSAGNKENASAELEVGSKTENENKTEKQVQEETLKPKEVVKNTKENKPKTSAKKQATKISGTKSAKNTTKNTAKQTKTQK